MVVRIPTKTPLRLCKDVSYATYLKPENLAPTNTYRPFATTTTLFHKSRNYKPRIYVDPWVLKHRAERKTATEARMKASRDRRAEVIGDPIRGAPAPTPFVASFDHGISPGHRMLQPIEFDQSPESGIEVGQSLEQDLRQQEQNLAGHDTQARDSVVSRESGAPKPHVLNHFITLNEFEKHLADSKELTSPYISIDRTAADPTVEHRGIQQHSKQHQVRVEALRRIVAPDNASARERLLLNKRRCIEKFGRHNTDSVFPRREVLPDQHPPKVKERIGPDTGSSEVQIAILTAKIRALADKYESPKGCFDWVNKRNLRLLLHRRQKLLKYFQKKDRGGKRWHHMLETLGLTEATWKGEIELR